MVNSDTGICGAVVMNILRPQNLAIACGYSQSSNSCRSMLMLGFEAVGNDSNSIVLRVSGKVKQSIYRTDHLRRW